MIKKGFDKNMESRFFGWTAKTHMKTVQRGVQTKEIDVAWNEISTLATRKQTKKDMRGNATAVPDKHDR